MVLAQIRGYLDSKYAKGWNQRRDGLFEDCVGNVFTLDIGVTSTEVSIRMKAVAIARTF